MSDAMVEVVIGNTELIEVSDQTILEVPSVTTEIVESVLQGPAGPAGPMGPAGLVNAKLVVTSEDLDSGNLVNLYNNAGVLTARKAVASTLMQAADGFVKTASISGDNASVFFDGEIEGLSGLIPGTRYYLSDSVPGGVTDTPVSGIGKIHQYVGKATSTVSLDTDIGGDYVKLKA